MLKHLKQFALVLALPFSVMAGVVEPSPFFVSKLAPTGNYTTKSFVELWDAFRDQYRIGPKGTFVQHPFAKTIVSLKSAQGAPLAHLFFRKAVTAREGVISGAQNQSTSFRNNATVRSAEEARDYILSKAGREVTLRVGNQSLVTQPGAFECIVVRGAIQEQDQDLRATPRPSGLVSEPTFFLPADPASVIPGEMTFRVYRSFEERGFYVEVGRFPDTKANQDNFLDALKAGSSFRVYTFKEGSCWNCAGLGRISTAVAKATSSLALSSSASVTNIDRKCECCSGSGRLPLGYISVLVWDRYVPQVLDSDRFPR